jgi:hypothetical protein
MPSTSVAVQNFANEVPQSRANFGIGTQAPRGIGFSESPPI